MDIKIKIFAASMAVLNLLPGLAAAEYQTDSDTGTEIFDYIENRRRTERLNALSDEQKQMIADTKEMEKNLRHPVDPTKASPVAFEGDDLTYDEVTGDFVAKGKVNILQLENRRFISESAEGNIATEDIHIPGKAHMLQLTPKMSRVVLDGYEVRYNYGQRTGTMDEAKGKVDHEYVTGKRFEFYPDKIVAYDGTMTRCNAKKPDYHMSADKIEIWPNDKYVMYNVKFWLKGAVLYSRDRYEQKIGEKEKNNYPRVGYSKDDGAWLSYDYDWQLFPNISSNSHFYVDTKHGIRSHTDLSWDVADSHYKVEYGYFEDNDQEWIKKTPSFIYNFSRPIELGTHLHYGLHYEIGRWYGEKRNISSTHRNYWLGLWRDPIIFHNWMLFLGASYSITKESYDNSKVDGFNYNAVLGKEFDDRLAAYVGYYYTKNNSTNSLFDYDLDSYSSKLQTGVSYRLTDNDRLVAGMAYDTQTGSLKDVDYYWYHDLHCSQVIVRYRQKRDSVRVQWQFTPW